VVLLANEIASFFVQGRLGSILFNSVLYHLS